VQQAADINLLRLTWIAVAIFIIKYLGVVARQVATKQLKTKYVNKPNISI
jgi:hypothetical protein